MRDWATSRWIMTEIPSQLIWWENLLEKVPILTNAVHYAM